MNQERLDSLIESWAEGRLCTSDALELNDLLRSSSEARTRFKEAAQLHGLLHVAANALAIESVAYPAITETGKTPTTLGAYWSWRALTGLVAGLGLGIVGVSAVWAIAAQHLVAVSRTVPTLSDASFEQHSSPFVRGFPERFGQWGGDEVQVVDCDPSNIRDAEHALQFVTALPDLANPTSRAIACDIFQLVDLRDLQIVRKSGEDIVLELSANFLDQRPSNTQPSVTFFCQLYLFRGQTQEIHDHWPGSIAEAISSGSAQITTLGQSRWKEVTSRCLVPEQASFAVVHLAARPNLREPFPRGLLVDRVRLVAKTQPILPVRSQ
jgi:hypothetical protein